MIIGITGTNGAGKGAVVEYLTQKGFKHYSAREFIVDEIKRRGLSVDRSSMREIANDLRQIHRPTYIGEQLYNRAAAEGGNAIIESIRETAMAKFLKGKGEYLLAVDADREIRYERTVLRGSETDKVTFEQFCEQEDREMNATASWNMNIAGVMKLSDFTLQNNGTLEELHAQIDKVLAKISHE